ncbi:acetyl-CoA carboxylase biotin carboxylase subunit [candidate division KSB1 bacterium RBG_16_48_16]|nr:MAG: acetyl-CoA carboxylase biotin carboxylase subunit [candidate division KSB1 bacterium RBG_16_48_16]
MFKKILIANRGEIALRIIRACKELGLSTVAVHSVPDADSLHVRFADEVVCIGPGPSHGSYLSIPNIISAAEITNADAIHPGYGFLAESAYFAEICESCNLKFIGPKADVIAKMGDKAIAKDTMRSAGVPVIPGSKGLINNIEETEIIAEEIGYPVIIKAVAGGGGRGMRVVSKKSEIKNAFNTAMSEAQSAFNNPALYLEKYFENPRHIEIQILGDDYGNTVSLGERECSIQRKHQKLIEESPSPAVDETLRKKMSAAAMKGARKVGYNSAGTIEFLLDDDKKFYFMEMNTRIQVEHPVTEMVFGIDLIKEQIRLAAGEKVSPDLNKYKLRGHALECRVNAEDPKADFLPCPGKITTLHKPGGPGVRVDTHAYAHYVIPPYYDSLIAKVITHGKNREEAINRMERALEEFIIEGIKTTIPLHQAILRNTNFREGNFSTRFLQNFDFNSIGGSE